MQLKDYLDDAKITYEAFAALIGVANASVIGKYASGKRVPRRQHMAAIVRETGGKVQPNDFFITEAP